MMSITATQGPLNTLLDHFAAARQVPSFPSAVVETGAATAADVGAGETIRSLADDLQIHDFQSRLARFRQSVSALTEGGAQISGTVGPAGVSEVNIVLKSGESVYFADLPGNVRFSDTGDGGIEVVTDEFVRIYDLHGRLVSESAGGAPLEGSDSGDVIFNITGAQVNANDGNDTIFTMPGTVNIDAGDGDDRVYVLDGPGGGNTLSISLGAGNDSFRFLGAEASPTGHTLHVNGGDGDDTIDLNRGVAGGRIDAGNGDDSILSSELLLNLHILGGSGNDRISLKGLVNGSVDAGDGANTVDMESVFASKVRHDTLSSIHIMNAYAGETHSFARDNAGRWVPSDGRGSARSQISVTA